MSDRPGCVANVDDVPMRERDDGATFAVRQRKLAAATGGRQLGCSWIELPPGRQAWPHHYHLANEEAMFVLEGQGTLRVGDRRVPLRPGDYVALPVGAAFAHCTINTGDAPLRYLCISTMRAPEVAVYPDSDKVGVISRAPGDHQGEGHLVKWYRLEDEVDYWDREG